MTVNVPIGVLERMFGVVIRPQTYRNLAYLVLSVPLTAGYSLLLGPGVGIGAALALFGVGLLLLLGCFVTALGFADLERALAVRLLGVEIPWIAVTLAPGASATTRLRARLIVAHGIADDSIPFTESLRLAAAAGDRAHLALFETFHHTGPQTLWTSLTRRARDGWSLVRVVDELLPH